MYQSGGRIFGAGDHIGPVVDLADRWTDRQTGQSRSDQTFQAAVERKVERVLGEGCRSPTVNPKHTHGTSFEPGMRIFPQNPAPLTRHR